MKCLDYNNKMVHHIFIKEIPIILPNVQQQKIVQRGTVTSLVTRIIGLAYEGISSSLLNKRQKVLQKIFRATILKP